jgi:hypothetical protein
VTVHLILPWRRAALCRGDVMRKAWNDNTGEAGHGA